MLILEFCIVSHNSKANWNEKSKNKLLNRNVKFVHWRGRQWNNLIREYILSKDLAEVEANATRASVRFTPHYVPGLCQQFAVAHTLHGSISLLNTTPSVIAFNQITRVTGHVTTHSHKQIYLEHSTP